MNHDEINEKCALALLAWQQDDATQKRDGRPALSSATSVFRNYVFRTRVWSDLVREPYRRRSERRSCPGTCVAGPGLVNKERT